MSTPHPHAESMRLYAEDAAETDTPWRQWEFRRMHCTDWLPCSCHPAWNNDRAYRRKPCTITVNGIEVPEPVRRPLEDGDRYWYVSLQNAAICYQETWTGGAFDLRILERGLIHMTEEAARLHAEALLAPSKVQK